MNILGMRIDNLNTQEVLKKISDFLGSDISHKIFTPNPEMLVDAQKDQYFREVLNSGDLNVCDSFGLSLVSGAKRLPGVDLMMLVCQIAESQNKSIYLLGSGSQEVIDGAKKYLEKKFPQLRIVGGQPGLKIDKIKADEKDIIVYDKEKNADLIHDIIMSAPDILFVAFGHIKQEKWIQENLADLPSVKIAMGLGGSFDFISGKIKRAPKFLRLVGLEWLYRLSREPKRIKRIWKATVVFLILAIKNKKK